MVRRIPQPGLDECRYRNIRIGLGGFLGYRMDMLLVRGIPFSRPKGPLAPVHARVEARSITLALRDQPAKPAWMSHQQQVPFDLVLEAAYDPATTTPGRRAVARDRRDREPSQGDRHGLERLLWALPAGAKKAVR